MNTLKGNATFHGLQQLATRFAAWGRIYRGLPIDGLVQLPRRQLRLAYAAERRRDHRHHEPRDHDGEEDRHGPPHADALRGDAGGVAPALDANDVVPGQSRIARGGRPFIVGVVEVRGDGIPGETADAGLVGLAFVGDRVDVPAEGAGGLVHAKLLGELTVERVGRTRVVVAGERVVDQGLLRRFDDEAASPPEPESHHDVKRAPEQTGAKS